MAHLRWTWDYHTIDRITSRIRLAGAVSSVHPHRVDHHPAIAGDGFTVQKLPQPPASQQQPPAIPTPHSFRLAGCRPYHLDVAVPIPGSPRTQSPRQFPQRLLYCSHAKVGARDLRQTVERRVSLQLPGLYLGLVEPLVVLRRRRRDGVVVRLVGLNDGTSRMGAPPRTSAHLAEQRKRPFARSKVRQIQAQVC